MTISSTEFKTNLGKYIDYIAGSDEEIIVTKNGKKVLSVRKPVTKGAERLSNLVKPGRTNWNYEQLKKAAMEEKYEITL